MATANARSGDNGHVKQAGPLARLRTLARRGNNGNDNSGGGCCHGAEQTAPTGLPIVALVGNPNVGKSVTFNRLTGIYAAVSNYPGTTVDVSRGKGTFGARQYEVVDTPGMYSLLPITEEERVARTILLAEKPVAVVHVVDAKNVERMLPYTLQLVEAGLPVILNLNLMDEAEHIGMTVDLAKLGEALGVPVVPTVATTGRGLAELRKEIDELASRSTRRN
ncbi:MAG: FeoB small GTPase domain-containing protein [Chloroflexota bacterium]